LKRKYGDSIERVLAHRAQLEEELKNLSVSEEELGALRGEVDSLRNTFRAAAEKLSESRRDLAKQFSLAVVSHLQTLAMERARFEVGFERDENGSSAGIDRVEFLLSANPGQPPRGLSRIASGGEISRVMLALRSVLSTRQSTLSPTNEQAQNDNENGANKVPVLIFDEIDVGIGGVTAEAVGEKMQELARHFQVFCVTHLPQIARRADRHYRVRKESDESQTQVKVELLEGDDRVREVARMMGRESEANLRHARDLLNEAAQHKPSVELPTKPSVKKPSRAKRKA